MNTPSPVQLLSPTLCESYSVAEMRKSTGKRKRVLPAVRKQTTTAFLAALADGDVKTAQLLLDSSLSVSTADRLGRTALHLATCMPSTSASQEICHTLLERMSDVNKGDLFGMSPFFYAVSTQNLPIVSAMLQLAKVDKCDKFGNTSLHHAAATGNIFTVTAISRLTEKINKTNILGFTPLMVTSKLGYVDCAKILTKHGAVSGSIRDMHCYLTAEDWAKFSKRFTDGDLKELKSAERHYKSQSGINKSDRGYRETGANEVYRTTSMTLPLSIGSENDQTQLMIKRVMLLRKLSEFFNTSGKKLQVRGQLSESTLEVREKASGSVKSISVNEILDEHLSKLTLGGVSNQRKNPTKTTLRQERPDSSYQMDSNSDDSMLTRQARVIEKGNVLRRKQSRDRKCTAEGSGKRAPLEPSIITLVHPCLNQASASSPTTSRTISVPRVPTQTPRSSVNSRENSPPQYKVNHVTSDETLAEGKKKCEEEEKEKEEVQKEVRYITDKTNEPYVTRSKLPTTRHSVVMGRNPAITALIMGRNPTQRTKSSLLPQYCVARKRKKRVKDKISDNGFGPWITEQDRGFGQTFIETTSNIPRIKIDIG